MKENVLLVDDEKALRSSLGVRLRGEGYLVDTAANATEGFQKATSLPFDVIILDLMLPDRSGLDLCREIREAGIATPLIVLSARQRTTDKVVALNSGADLSPADTSRLERELSRYDAIIIHHHVDPVLALYISRTLGKKTVWYSGSMFELAWEKWITGEDYRSISRTVNQTSEEYYGRVFSSLLLSDHLFGQTARVARTVDVHVASLRNKLEENPSYPELIVTVSRVGYKFVGSRRS